MSFQENKHQKTVKRANGRLRVITVCDGPSRTKQAMAAECDINNIMKTFKKTGVLPEMIKRNPSFGDFAKLPDFQEAQNILALANEQFDALNSKIRKRFNNDPADFLAFTQDAANAPEMAKLGLLKPEAVQRVAQAKAAHKNESNEPKKGAAPDKGSDPKTSS